MQNNYFHLVIVKSKKFCKLIEKNWKFVVKLIVKVKLLPIDLKNRILPFERDSTTAHQRLLDKSIVKVKQFSRPWMFTKFHVDWKIFKHGRRTERQDDKSNRELLRLVDVYDTETEKHFLPDNERCKHQKLGTETLFNYFNDERQVEVVGWVLSHYSLIAWCPEIHEKRFLDRLGHIFCMKLKIKLC